MSSMRWQCRAEAGYAQGLCGCSNVLVCCFVHAYCSWGALHSSNQVCRVRLNGNKNLTRPLTEKQRQAGFSVSTPCVPREG